jgi:hypothetical protein
MSSVAGAGRRFTSHLVVLVSMLRPMTGLGAELNAEVDAGFWRCEVKYSCSRYGRPFETSAHVKTDKRAGQRLPQILYGPKASCLREPFVPSVAMAISFARLISPSPIL